MRSATGSGRCSTAPGTLGDLARAHALLTAHAPDADPLYLEAIGHHERTRGLARRARSHRLYGEWLRRERRTRDARRQLRIAHGLFFDAMGALGHTGRTARELAAAADPVPPAGPADGGERSAGGPDGLTAQETRVARLAAAGATDAEIAAQLFLSAHTVDYHLRRVFRNLGVRSRRALSDRPARDFS
ncbi:helix-turn-helix transcriptional regulator [Actinacidiphila sp. ITFR-21]|uniref:helix-turn-helix transcriptional regulator n=1 Tax=Actinacidiphila sp. ITFR-21 TaxID=3075199 RepID=UPI00288958C2|nr:helix-turn-helix transcriptional regulator [Streptomyces sp. ITFR-21]WNI16136.1 helix-turn-helix transcriptional regulator [Streptomyces sp. ITFR-21]